MRWIQRMDCICAGESIALGPLVVAGMGQRRRWAEVRMTCSRKNRAYVDADARVCDVLEYAGADCVEAAARLRD